MTEKPLRDDHTIPLWMRKSTLWVVFALSVGLFALIAYYLLPGWWAQLVNTWVRSIGPVITGLLVGFLPVFIGTFAFRGALAMGARGSEDDGPTRGDSTRHVIRLILGVLGGLGLAALLLTVSIALGFTEPLREARGVWQGDASAVLWSSLVGGLLALIVVLGIYALRLRLTRAPKAVVPDPIPREAADMTEPEPEPALAPEPADAEMGESDTDESAEES